MNHKRILTVAIIFGCCLATYGQERTWTDNTGKFKVKAELKEATKTHVVLVRADGQTAKMQRTRLSKNDQRYVIQWLARQTKKTKNSKTNTAKTNPAKTNTAKTNPAKTNTAKTNPAKTNTAKPKPAKTSTAKTNPANAKETNIAKANGSGSSQPLKCKINGVEFLPDEIELSNGILTFKKGKDFLPESEVKLFLFADGQIEGKTFSASAKGGNLGSSPHVHVTWTENGERKTEIQMQGYDLKLTFGKTKDKQIPGNILLKMPKFGCELSGHFVVGKAKDFRSAPTSEDGPYVVGRIKLVGAEEVDLSAGYMGIKSDGKWTSNLAGTKLRQGDKNARVTSMTFKPRTTTLFVDGDEFVCQHLVLEPAKTFMYVKANSEYISGEWIEVTDSTKQNLTFMVDLTLVGELEVTVDDEDAKNVVAIPLGEKNDVPSEIKDKWLTRGPSIQKQLEGDDYVIFEKLKPGWYHVRVGKNGKDVEVKADELTELSL